MYYRLNPEIALRSWWYVPNAYYIRGEVNAKRLTADEFALMSLCDSEHDLPESTLTEDLARRKLIMPCERGAAPMTPWQRMKCGNRYFPAINWALTGKCNYNCLHCFNCMDNAPLMGEFTFEEAERLLDEARDAGINAFTLTGGEPMLHPRFLEIVEGIHRRGMFVHELNTNGFRLKPEVLDRFRSIGCDPLIKISFDGLGHHDWMRNHTGAERSALNAIRLCVERGFRVKVQMNVHRGNLDTLSETLDRLDGMGVVETRLIRTSESPRWNLNAPDLTLTFEEYYEAMLSAVKTYAEKPDRGMRLDCWQFLRVDPRRRDYAIHPVTAPRGCYSPYQAACKGTRGLIAIDADGELYPCHQVSGEMKRLGITLGNVKKNGLTTYLREGDYLKTVCMPVQKILDAGGKCAGCRHFAYCCGGCRTLAFGLSGSPLGEDPTKCCFFENGYVERITRVLDGWTNRTPI